MAYDASIFGRFTQPRRGGLWPARRDAGRNRAALRRELIVYYQTTGFAAHERFVVPQTRDGRAGAQPQRRRAGPAGGPGAGAARRDAGRGAAAAADRGRAHGVPGRGLAGAGRGRPAAQKKTLHATARDTPRVVALRGAFAEAVARDEGPSRFKFVDETGLHLAFARRHGRAVGGQRAGQRVPWRVGTPVAVMGASVRGLEAVMRLDGAVNQDRFAACLEHVLGPARVPGDVVVPDNLRVHRVAGVAELVEARGARLLFLPPYSPDFAPIEQAWSELKTKPRAAQARPRHALEEALGPALAWNTGLDAQNWFGHCGHHVPSL